VFDVRCLCYYIILFYSPFLSSYPSSSFQDNPANHSIRVGSYIFLYYTLPVQYSIHLNLTINTFMNLRIHTHTSFISSNHSPFKHRILLHALLSHLKIYNYSSEFSQILIDTFQPSLKCVKPY
jgi:hypothetical protein